MKTLSFALLLVTVVALVVVGCSDNSTPVLTPTEQVVSSAASPGSLAKGGILNSATGSAHWKTVPVVETVNGTYSFTAVRHSDGVVSGELVMKDKGHVFDGKAYVYDLKVSDNIAKLAFHFVKGNLGAFFATQPDITEIYGWLIIVDNGEGSGATDPDYVSLILFTDGSDILDKEISDVDNMDIPTYLAWMHDELLPSYGVAYDDWLTPIDHGNVQVR